MSNYLLALDQGTTSSRSILFRPDGGVVSVAQKELTQHYPQPGWVEHDPEEIWKDQLETARDVLRKAGVRPSEVGGIGITNQRETTVLWDSETGKALHNALVWQDRRTSKICDGWKWQGLEDRVKAKAGLPIDAYFSASKIRWLLDEVPAVREAAQKKRLRFGTVDSWLIWNLTNGAMHVTDASNASRTMLFNIAGGHWDEDLLQVFGIPSEVLPTVVDSAGAIADTDPEHFEGTSIPITGIAGDQQAALFGQCCFEPGMAKNTYGTGCFLLMNTGAQAVPSKHGLISTVAWRIDGAIEYALEGSVFMGGATLQWLRDGLQIIDDAAESEALASSVPDTQGVIMVPAFTGLGAPYWDMHARAALLGMTRGTDRRHIVRAALEAIAYQCRDLVDAMREDSGNELNTLRVDGGATRNDFLMQFQADILNVPVERPKTVETTALGAAWLAGIGAGILDKKQVGENWGLERRFDPRMDRERRETLYDEWKAAVARVRSS